MAKEFDKVLDSSEKIIWEGTPKFWPFFLGGPFVISIIGLIWTIVIIFVLSMIPEIETASFPLIFLPHFWIGILMLVGPIAHNFLVFKHTIYAITGKRVIAQGGIIGRDFEMIDLDKIASSDVSVGLFDKLFAGGNTGTILISSTGTAHLSVRSILNPYDIVKLVKR